MQRISLELPQELAQVRQTKLNLLSKRESQLRAATSEQMLFSHVKELVRELLPSGSLSFRFFLKQDYEKIFDNNEVGPKFQRCLGRARIPGNLFTNLNSILAQIDCQPPTNDSPIVPEEGLPQNKGVIYLPNSARGDFFFLCQMDVAVAKFEKYMSDPSHLFVGQWENQFAKRLGRLPWMKSVLILPILEVDKMLGAVVISSSQEFVNPPVDMPWLMELSNLMGTSLFDLMLARMRKGSSSI